MSTDPESKPAASRFAARALLSMLLVGVVLAACTQDSWLDPVLHPGGPQSLPTSTPAPATATAPGAPTATNPATTVPSTQNTGDPAFSLAWFHKPPEDGSTPGQIASGDGYIHLTGEADIPYREELRAAGFGGPIYTYLVAYIAAGPGPYKDSSASCEAGYVPHDNNFAWATDDFCKYLHPYEDMFMHNGAGERLVMDYFGSGRWTYMMNPASERWREFSYSRLEKARETWGYDGVWLDNLDLDLTRAHSDMANSDNRVQEFANDKAFQEAMKGWLAGAKDRMKGWPIWANLIADDYSAKGWDAYAPYLDGGMEESFAVSWIENWLSTGNWSTQIERAERWLASGKGLVMVGQGPKEDTNRMRFALASYMLVAQPGKSFFRYTRFDTYYGEFWNYNEYETALALGTPTGARQLIKPGVWRRQFTGGYVEVDVNEYNGQLVLQ